MRREDGGNGKNPRCRSTDPGEMRMRILERIHIKICLMFGIQTLDSFGEGPSGGSGDFGELGLWGGLGFLGFCSPEEIFRYMDIACTTM